MSEAVRACLAFLANEPHGAVDCEDSRLDQFCDDGDPDTLNQCFNAGWARQLYNTSLDAGTVRITEAGRRALEAGDG